MTIMWILLSIPLAAIGTRIFAKQAAKAEAGGQAATPSSAASARIKSPVA
jgi:hypothetical protein